MEDFAKPQGQTIFNEALAVINRIDALVTTHHKSILSKEYETALTSLDLFYQEISAKLSDDEITQVNEKKSKAISAVEKLLDDLSKQARGFKKRTIMIDRLVLKSCKDSLDSYMKILKKMEDVKGLGVPNKPSPHDAILGGK